MIIVCPNCSTRFNLPDAQVRPGVRLRCSVCKHVFPLPCSENPVLPSLDGLSSDGGRAAENVSPSLDASIGDDGLLPPLAKKKSHNGLVVTLLFLVLVLCGAAYLYVSPPEGFDLFHRLEKSGAAANLVGEIGLVDVRQYPVSNEQIGSITVIEGKLVNNFKEPRELMRIEASLYDKDNKALVSKEQLAGNSVSLFQLQVLSEAELEQALSNKLGVMANNTNVAPGSSVPFMIAFCNPPREAVEFGVKVIDARRPEAK